MRTLSAIVELCRAGRRELLRRWADNELSLHQVWTAAMGATTCIEEIATKGEAAMVDEEAAAARLRVCDTCPSRTTGRAARVKTPEGEEQWVRSWYCGPALEAVHGQTCGCLLAMEVVRPEGENAEGRIVRLNVLPVCAALLKSKQCWQGKWAG